MPQIKFSQLPDDLRVQLSEEGREELWHRIDEFGGIKEFSEHFEFSQSKMYNWKNKELALPIKIVRRVLGKNATEEITLLKGKGSSDGIKNPEFPLQISNELLTRVEKSVVKNTEGTPVYLTDERSLVNRFTELLNEVGEADFSVYSRSLRYEVRYPKFLNILFLDLEYNSDLSVEIDEVGKIIEDKIAVEGRKLSIWDFNGKIYSKEKRYKIALKRGESSKIEEIINEEVSKTKRAILS